MQETGLSESTFHQLYCWIPKWLSITIISRDLIVVIGWFLLYMITHNSSVQPILMGKVAIVLQTLTLAYVLLEINMNSLPHVPETLLIITAFVTALSGFQYIYKGFKLTNAL